MAENSEGETHRSPPISEMSIVIQFQAKRPFSPRTALALQTALRAELPEIELRQRIQRLGAVAEPELILEDELSPRWWFVSPQGERLLQVQNDLVALNWRRREGAPPYPGFEEMIGFFHRYLRAWLDHVPADSDEVAVCSLMYDNVWPLAPGIRVADVFSFWNTVGLGGRQVGPEVRWKVGLDDAELGETGHLDLLAGIGGLVGPSPTRAARLQFNGYGFPSDTAGVDAAIRTMHRHIHAMLERLITPTARANW